MFVSGHSIETVMGKCRVEQCRVGINSALEMFILIAVCVRFVYVKGMLGVCFEYEEVSPKMRRSGNWSDNCNSCSCSSSSSSSSS